MSKTAAKEKQKARKTKKHGGLKTLRSAETSEAEKAAANTFPQSKTKHINDISD